MFRLGDVDEGCRIRLTDVEARKIAGGVLGGNRSDNTPSD